MDDNEKRNLQEMDEWIAKRKAEDVLSGKLWGDAVPKRESAFSILGRMITSLRNEADGLEALLHQLQKCESKAAEEVVYRILMRLPPSNGPW